jgi:hypothetical protein
VNLLNIKIQIRAVFKLLIMLFKGIKSATEVDYPKEILVADKKVKKN